MEFVGFICLGHFFYKLCKLVKRPLVNRVQISDRNRLYGCIKIIEVTNLKAQCIADVPVIIGNIAHDFVRNRHIPPVVL